LSKNVTKNAKRYLRDPWIEFNILKINTYERYYRRYYGPGIASKIPVLWHYKSLSFAQFLSI